MLRRRLISVVLPTLGALALVAAACPGFGDDDPAPGALPTYVEHVKPLFASERAPASCLSCHSETRDDAPFRLDRCEDEAGAAGARSAREAIATVVQSDGDERHTVSAEERALLLAWRDAGGDCEPSFEEHVSPLFELHCVSCHGAGASRDPSAEELGLRLDLCTVPPDDPDGELGAKEAAESIRLYMVESSPPLMPPAGEPQLTGAELLRLKLWLAQPDLPCTDEAPQEAAE